MSRGKPTLSVAVYDDLADGTRYVEHGGGRLLPSRRPTAPSALHSMRLRLFRGHSIASESLDILIEGLVHFVRNPDQRSFLHPKRAIWITLE
jgi:hypothetical protein